MTSLLIQLEKLSARLRVDHPELLGIGLGYRRRRGMLTNEKTIKLLVRKKDRSRRRSSKFFPRSLPIEASVVGQRVVAKVPVDVEVPRRMRSSSGSVDGMRVAAVACWRTSSGDRAFGVVTASHGLPSPVPGGGVPSVPVQLRNGTTSGRVVAKSSLPNDGIDVGLVWIDDDPSLLMDVAPMPFDSAGADYLLEKLSDDATDLFFLDGQSWAASSPTNLQAVAFYASWTWQGMPFTLRRVVECSCGIAQGFEPGTSGGVWVVPSWDGRPLAAAIQSHGQPPLFQAAVGSHFQSAVSWLRSQPGLGSLRVAWRVADLM